MDKHLAQRLILAVVLLGAIAAGEARAGVLDELERIGKPVNLGGQRDFLPPDEAFRLRESVAVDGTLEVHWDIEPGYYLYRDKMGLSALSDGAALDLAPLPPGEAKDDPEFGRVDIYRDQVTLRAAVTRRPDSPLLETEVRYQGCAEDGICYPPIKKTLGFALVSTAAAAPAPSGAAAPAADGAAGLSASDRIALSLSERSLATTVLTFLGLGLLLAFTPCVLPMVPILSGIIVGQQQPVSTGRAVALSTVYVVAMALTYTVAGIVAGLAGQNLQAAFQHPAVITAFAGVFVALALSMFGLYELQVPAALQSRLDALSRRQRSGSFGGVAVMGVLSAVIVGPCVAPPLAGALAYIGQTGSPLIGGAALFALGLGMGAPLILVGASAGALLPRAGIWMERVKAGFGVVFLGVAVWFLERVVPAPLALALWAALLIGSAVFLGALRRTDAAAPVGSRLAQAGGVFLLIYGVVLLVGAAAGARDPLAPLAPLAGGGATRRSAPAFIAVKSAADVAAQVRAANAAGRAAMLDVYADWCVECKHLERETFTAPAVRERLDELVLLRADVTANDAADQALLAQYGLFGPPAILFFRDGEEDRRNRLVGFLGASEFATLIDTVRGAR